MTGCGVGNRLGDEGFQQLVHTLSSLPHVTVLDVSSNGLTEQSLDSLASLLTSPSTSALQVCQRYHLYWPNGSNVVLTICWHMCQRAYRDYFDCMTDFTK